MEDTVLLEVKDLVKYFPIKAGFLRKTVGHIKAVDGVSFTLHNGETLGLVGESGCGKSTCARTIMRAYEPTAGQIWFSVNDQRLDIAALDRRGLEPVYREIQMVFQDPFSSLNPRMTVQDIVGEPLLCNHIASGSDLKTQVQDLLVRVGLKAQHLERYPHAFSGGQKQRIAIARALAVRPKLIVADESVSALDVSIQAQIINLMRDLQEDMGVAYLFIAHDLSVVRYISHRIAVMYVGDLVELSESDRVFKSPRHPYTDALISAIPKSSPFEEKVRIILGGNLPDPSADIVGCKFAGRCRYSQKRCETERPQLRDLGDGTEEHLVACHYPLPVDSRQQVS